MASSRKCAVCGTAGVVRAEPGPARESGRCDMCGARQRDRDQALAILEALAGGQAVSLASMSRAMRKAGGGPRILEVAYASPFAKVFGELPGYVRGYRWPDGAGRVVGGVHIPYVDLENLPFEDRSFDLVITSEVMNFVQNDEVAFREILRVLKPGGCHVASLPISWPYPERSEEHYEWQEGRPIARTAERKIKAPCGSDIPVMRSYGLDVFTRLDSMGYATELRRSGFFETAHRRNATLVATRIIGD